MAALHTLLQWSTANTPAPSASTSTSAAPFSSQPSASISSVDDHDAEIAASAQRTDINTAMLDHIMGKSDAVLMREKMEVMLDEGRDLEARMVAMDDYEMLIESIDNANDIQAIQHWPSLVSLLRSEEDEIVRGSLWICGTAVQNNWKAQENFLNQQPLPIILSLITPAHPTNPSTSISASTRSKAVYCLSSTLKHWPATVSLLDSDSARGWRVLRDGLKDSELQVRRKVAFLIGSLVLQSVDVWTRNGEKDEGAPVPAPRSKDGMNEILDRMQRHGLIDTLVSAITSPLPSGPDGEVVEPDWDFNEKSVRALLATSERDGLSENQKTKVRKVLQRWDTEGLREDAGFGEEEWRNALRSI